MKENENRNGGTQTGKFEKSGTQSNFPGEEQFDNTWYTRGNKTYDQEDHSRGKCHRCGSRDHYIAQCNKKDKPFGENRMATMGEVEDEGNPIIEEVMCAWPMCVSIIQAMSREGKEL